MSATNNRFLTNRSTKPFAPAFFAVSVPSEATKSPGEYRPPVGHFLFAVTQRDQIAHH